MSALEQHIEELAERAARRVIEERKPGARQPRDWLTQDEGVLPRPAGADSFSPE